MYDVIIVGARCAGSPLAMLLARRGARVLVVDRSTFPSDTMNGHFIVAAGVRRLRQWGLLERVLEGAGQPALQHRYHLGSVSLAGTLAWPDGEPAFGLAPRRKRLDALLVDAAVEAGAEVRQAFTVDELVWDGPRVAGVRGRGTSGGSVVERARLVVGADGFRSRVAAAVGASVYETIEPRTSIYYSHWADWPASDARAITVYGRPGCYTLNFPTDSDLMCVAVGWPNNAFSRVRADIECEFLAALEGFPRLAEHARVARRVEPFRGTADLPFFLRQPWGSGWALVGDAGCRVDPITGQGVTDAFRDADLLAAAIGDVLSGGVSFDTALADYQRRRDTAVLPIYRYTSERARLAPPSPEAQRLFAGLVDNQHQQDRFAGLTAGITPFDEFFSTENIASIIAGAAAPARAA
jgi:flavin-dependent dehydrogenase